MQSWSEDPLKRETYESLAQSEEYEDNPSATTEWTRLVDGPDATSNAPKSPARSLLNTLIFALILLNTFLVLCVCFVVTFSKFHTVQVVDPDYHVQELEYRSPYINFDSLFKSKTVAVGFFQPKKSSPRIIVTVDSTTPNLASPIWEDGGIVPTGPGTISGYTPIAEKRVIANSTICTIAQFRVTDYGMENCSIGLTTPATNETDSHAVLYDTASSASWVSLDVWLLHQDSRLDESKLTWNNKPSRERYLGMLAAGYGSASELKENFECRSGTYKTVEICCKSCHYDAMHEAWEKSPLYMLQHQTLV